jgi:hypothetical protein
VLALAALALGATNVTALTAGVAIDPRLGFSEDTEVWAAPGAAAPASVLWGSLPSPEDAYWRLVVSGEGQRISADPYGAIDGGAIPGGYYDVRAARGWPRERAHARARAHPLLLPRARAQMCCVYKPWKGEALPALLSPRFEALLDAPKMIAFVQRRFSFGTWTQPDACAPPTGACSDGSGRCAGWLGSPCGAGTGTCKLDLVDYGVKFGPANMTHPNGKCIAGGGRFPDLHGKNKDAGLGDVPLVERLYAALPRGAAARA